MLIIDKIKTILDRIIIFIASFLLVVLVLGALWQVFTRYVLDNPSTFTNELLGFLLVWTALLAATYAFGSNQHLALTFVNNKLSRKKKLAVSILNDILILSFAFVIMVQGGMEAVSITMTQTTPILGIPKGLVYLILPVSGVLIIFYKLLNIKTYFEVKEEGD